MNRELKNLIAITLALSVLVGMAYGATRPPVVMVNGELTNANGDKINADTLVDGSTNAIITLSQETNFQTAYEAISGTAFGISPSTAPTTDFQYANKKYVDDNAGVSPWTDSDPVLEPTNTRSVRTKGSFQIIDSTNRIDMVGTALGIVAANQIYASINGAEILYATEDGEITQPLQPCFQARPTSTQSNLATDTTVVFGTEIFDVGNNFASNTFTAPVDGRYDLSVGLRLQQIDSAATYIRILIMTSNRHYDWILDPTRFAADVAYYPVHNSVIADMDANDTAYILFQQSGGAAQTDVATTSYFSGSLIN